MEDRYLGQGRVVDNVMGKDGDKNCLRGSGLRGQDDEGSGGRPDEGQQKCGGVFSSGQHDRATFRLPGRLGLC